MPLLDDSKFPIKMKQLKNSGFELKRQITLPNDYNESKPEHIDQLNTNSPIQIWRNQVQLRTQNYRRKKINDNRVFVGSISPKRWRTHNDTKEIAAILKP
jgi:hypothetical protein